MAVGADADVAQAAIIHRQRQIWWLLTLSMVLFLGLCAALSWGVSGFLGGVTDSKSASLQAVPPSTLGVLRHNTTSPELVTGSTTLQEGDSVTTGKSDEAFISLFGDSGSITMFYNSQLDIDRLRASHFFQNSKDISIILHAGTITFATGDSGDYALATYQLSTDQAEIDVAPSSNLRVSVDGTGDSETTQVVVTDGQATLRSHGKVVEIGPQQMAWVTGTKQPDGPAPAEVDLIHNGSFDQPPTSNSEEVAEGGLGTAAWQPLRDDSGAISSPASVSITSEVSLKAAVITGQGTPNRYVRVGISQDVNRPASFFTTIELSATVKLVNQAFTAGGPANDVYPLTIRVVYTDQFGKNHEWKRSFFFSGNDPALDDNSIVKITQGRWTTTAEMLAQRLDAVDRLPGLNDVQVQNKSDLHDTVSQLFVLKSPSQVQDIAVINTIEVYGYGPQFQSWITNVSLMAR